VQVVHLGPREERLDGGRDPLRRCGPLDGDQPAAPSIGLERVGGYAAADIATGTEQTVLKGWTLWGKEAIPTERFPRSIEASGGWVISGCI
jgi:hypothetical protein